MDIYSWFLENYRQGSLDCQDGQKQLNSTCCATPDKPVVAEEANQSISPTSSPTPELTEVETAAEEADESTSQTPSSTPELTEMETETPTTQIPEFSEEDELALPEVTNLVETFYCGKDWMSVSNSCETATPCPSGEGCSSGEECIAYTNCGGKYLFVSNPTIEGGGPNVEDIKKNFLLWNEYAIFGDEVRRCNSVPQRPRGLRGRG